MSIEQAAQRQIHPELSRGEQIGRLMVRGVFYPLSRSEQVHVTDGMERAAQLHREGYGILNLITHFSRRDPITAMDSVIGHEEFRNERIVAPIAHHQNFLSFAEKFGNMTGVNMHDVVTPETMRRANRKGNPDGLKQGQGLLGFQRAASKALANGEVVVMAPQATRVPHLEYNEYGDGEASVKGVLRIASGQTTDIGIHLMAFELPGAIDYGQVAGFNWFKKYHVLHGPTFTMDEALQEASQMAPDPEAKNAGFDNVDKFIMAEYAKFVPESYLPKG